MDAGETVSRQCLEGEAYHYYPPALSLPRQALFPWPYVEGLSDARTTLADFFSILPGYTSLLPPHIKPVRVAILSAVEAVSCW